MKYVLNVEKSWEVKQNLDSLYNTAVKIKPRKDVWNIRVSIFSRLRLSNIDSSAYQ
jgi:flagellin-specific chaperone FliS